MKDNLREKNRNNALNETNVSTEEFLPDSLNESYQRSDSQSDPRSGPTDGFRSSIGTPTNGRSPG